ncbi:MAG: hypothetical protein WDZ41_03135 [Candidatus Babeliales bacterium]
MKLNRFIFLLSHFIVFNFAQAVFIDPGARNLIILLDWEHEQLDLKKGKDAFDAVTQSLVAALIEKENPILVSMTPWHNFVKRRIIFNDFINKPLDELVKKYESEFHSKESLTQFYLDSQALLKTKKGDVKIENFALCWALDFNQSDWIIKKIKNFYLLIPKKYLTILHEKQKIEINTIEAYKQNLDKKDLAEFIKDFDNFQCKAQLNENDLLLGLKISDKETVLDPFSYKTVEIKSQSDFAQEFLSILPQLFVTKRDIPKTTQFACLNSWYLYLLGHGQKDIIAQLPIKPVNYFQQFLLFLNSNINTQFLFYDTCKIGGIHLKIPYDQEWSYPLRKDTPLLVTLTKPIELNYILIASSFLYAPTYTLSLELKYNQLLQSFYAKAIQNYNAFFNLAHNYLEPKTIKKSISLPEIIEKVHPFARFTAPNLQVPIIRFPGTSWFSTIELDKKLFKLSQVLIATRQAENKPIIINNKGIIIIEPENFFDDLKNAQKAEILTQVKISGNKFPIFIPNSKKTSHFYLQEIDARDFDLKQIIEGFFKIRELEIPIRYYITKLTCKNPGFSIFNKKNTIELYDIVISHYVGKKNRIHFKFNGKKYKAILAQNQWNLKENDIEQTDEMFPPYIFKIQESKYKDLVDLLQKKIEKLEKSKEKIKPEKQEVSLLHTKKYLPKIYTKKVSYHTNS